MGSFLVSCFVTNKNLLKSRPKYLIEKSNFVQKNLKGFRRKMTTNSVMDFSFPVFSSRIHNRIKALFGLKFPFISRKHEDNLQNPIEDA